MRGTILTIVVCGAVALAGCGGSDSSSSTGNGESSTTAAKGAAAEVGKKKPKVEVPSGPPPKTLEKKEIVEGDGPEAKSGDEVTVQYVGVGYKSKEQFDASWDRGEPFPLTLGAEQVIPGWEEGIPGMKVGGRRELIIPASLAYGPAGRPPVIGPNEALIFVIDLLAVK